MKIFCCSSYALTAFKLESLCAVLFRLNLLFHSAVAGQGVALYKRSEAKLFECPPTQLFRPAAFVRGELDLFTPGYGIRVPAVISDFLRKLISGSRGFTIRVVKLRM
jgi:hypothetical protein